MMEQHHASEYKQTCIKPGCESQDLADMFNADGSPAPAKKCNKCGVISAVFNSKL